jgi:hypothetical protein
MLGSSPRYNFLIGSFLESECSSFWVEANSRHDPLYVDEKHTTVKVQLDMDETTDVVH